MKRILAGRQAEEDQTVGSAQTLGEGELEGAGADDGEPARGVGKRGNESPASRKALAVRQSASAQDERSRKRKT